MGNLPQKSERRPAGSNASDPVADAGRFLGRGDRSTDQVKSFLSGRGYSEAEIRATLRTLKRLGYLDDEAVAVWLAQARLARRPVGADALIETLKARAFSNETANRAGRKAYEATTEHAVAARFLSSLPVRFTDPRREARRRAALLTARRFPQDVIEILLAPLLFDQDHRHADSE